MKLRYIQSPETAFLTAEEVPPNLFRLKPGDTLTPKGRVRAVVRVGYRLHASDLRKEAEALLNTPEAGSAAMLLQRLCGAPLRLTHEVARALVQARGFGGPERGIHVEMHEPRGRCTVWHVRQVRLGTYYPGSGGWSHGPDGSEYDYENGGLHKPRTVILVTTDLYGEVISGDFERSPS